MRTEGYVIARNRKVDQFFTSSSAYDRPSWIPVTEATVYLTPEMAQKAAIKLATSGAYECRVVTIKEAMSLAMPMTQMSPMAPMGRAPGEDDDREGSMEVDIQPDGEGGTEMVAADSEEACQTCSHCPCTCHTDADGVDDIVDTELAGDVDPEMDEFGDTSMNPNTDITLDSKGERLAQQLSRGRGGLGESMVMPAKPPMDQPGDGNKNTALDVKGAEVIKFKNPAVKPDSTFEPGVDGSSEDKIKVPANVLSDLKAAIEEFKAAAEQSVTRDDAKAAFCMTVADAFAQLCDDLSQGTVAGVKMAQVHMTSYMNPITAHLPVSVQKFIFMGGKKPTLKDLFDDKRMVQKAMS
jgi:hypothetical protein